MPPTPCAAVVKCWRQSRNGILREGKPEPNQSRFRSDCTMVRSCWATLDRNDDWNTPCMGDTVNVASRLEVLTRFLGVGLVTSDDLVTAVRHDADADGAEMLSDLDSAGLQNLRGRDEPINAWTCASAFRASFGLDTNRACKVPMVDRSVSASSSECLLLANSGPLVGL